MLLLILSLTLLVIRLVFVIKIHILIKMKAASRVLISAALVSVAAHAFLLAPTTTRQHVVRFQQVAAGDDIIARARENAGMPDVPEAPQLFDEDLLDDMQQALLMMEKRIKEGPSSLTSVQVQDLGARLNRIVHEMKTNEHQSPKEVLLASNHSDQSAPAEAAPTTTLNQLEDETPSYDGKGGMGQPRGTINTYIIEGMEEMDSETYRLALQQSIIDRQRERRRSGKVGNRGSIDYLSTLSGSTDRKIMFDPEEKKNTKENPKEK